MTLASVFNQKSFQNPDNFYRPLQIIHGMNHHFPPEGNAASANLSWQVEQSPLPDTQQLDAFLEKLVQLGAGGIVTNVGFQDYLVSRRQWDILRYGIQKAADLGLRIWLYDEEGYPSGTAGGYVTRGNPENVVLGLACYSKIIRGPAQIEFPLPHSCRRFVWAGAVQHPETATRAEFTDLVSHVDEWQTLQWDVPGGEWTVLFVAERIMYEGTHSCNNVHALKPYINVLDPQPVRRFIELTHAAYARQLPPKLWEKIEAIFTDEPSFMTQYLPGVAGIYPGKIPVVDQPLFNDRPPAVPWHANLPAQFQSRMGYDLLPYVYALFCSESDEACYIRQAYYSVITRLYTAAFFVQIQDWCHQHRIASSGHVLLEETLVDQVGFSGSLMALLRRMDLPGIDMLNSDPQEMLHRGSFMGDSWMAAKVASSAAHLAGTARIHSESSDWEQRNKGRFASLDERRGQGNLQYVMGINTLTSYFGWSELGEAAQRQYHDYMGRLASLLTGGQHVCDVAVLYPIRSMWAHFLPPAGQPPSWAERTICTDHAKELNHVFPELVMALMSGQVDVDVIDEEGICAAEIRDGALHIAGESYRAVVLPPIDALDLATLRALERFAQAGGILLASGSLPRLAGSPQDTPALQKLAQQLFGGVGRGQPEGRAQVVDQGNLVNALQSRLGADLRLQQPNDTILYTHRQLEGRHIYFITNNLPQLVDIQPTLRHPGPYTLYRPLDGTVTALPTPLQVSLAGYEGIFIVTAA